MTKPVFSLTLCLSILPAVAFAASPKEPAAAPSAAPVNVLSSVGATAVSQPADSAGTLESLPDLPQVRTLVLSFGKQPAERPQTADRPSRISFGSPRSRGVSPLASMPLAGAARRLGAERFNTDDGSMLDDFAICYRMTGRSSIEIIPGDPAPVKLPVVSMANNTGVTVGLVLRLSK